MLVIKDGWLKGCLSFLDVIFSEKTFKPVEYESFSFKTNLRWFGLPVSLTIRSQEIIIFIGMTTE